ncbi:MAG: PEGA domain-containing protein, partial [Myxococcales bacterium]
MTPLELPLEEPGAGMSHRYELRLEGYEPFVVDQAPARESVRMVVPLRAAPVAPTATGPTGRPVTRAGGGHTPTAPPTGATGAAGRPADPVIRLTRLRGSMHRRGSRGAAWLALALVLWSGRGRADDVADEAELYFKVGAEKFLAREYRGALEYFLRSNRLVPNRNVVFNIARSYELLGQLNDAFRYYTLALEGETDETARRAVEGALNALRSRVAVLEVVSEPPGATIYIDRKDLGARGVAPRSLAFGAGTYRVLASLPGHADATPVEVKLELGKSTRVKVALTRLLGTVIFEGAPAGSRARIDGGDEVPLEGDALAVPPGRHQVVLRAPGYQDDPHLVEIEADQTIRQPARLQPQLGSVIVETDERDAQILIDGRPVGFTPSVVAAAVGQHQLQLRLPGFREVRRTIEVSPGEPLRVEAELREVAEISAASRAVESVNDAPSSVSVLTRQDLRAFAYPTIAEALRGLRGFYVGDSSSYGSVGVRGFSRLGDYGQRVLVLLDGHPTNDDYIGSSYVGLDNRVDLEDIERIEVVRGPGSVVYGTNAFLGVVNLVPRQGRGRTGGEVGASVFDHGLARGRARADVALGSNASAWVSVMGARGAGRDFTFSELAGADGSVPTASGADGVKAGTAQGEVRWRDLRVQGFYTARNKYVPTGAYETVLGDKRTSLRDTRGFVEVRYEPRLLESLQLLTRAHANLYNFRGRYAYAPTDGGLGVETFQGRWYGGELRMLFTPTPTLRVMFGGEAQLHTTARLHGQDDTAVYLDDNHPFRVAGAYTSVDWSPIEALRLSGGARLDYFSTFNGVSLNPRLAAILKPAARTVIKVIGARAFRAPSVYEFYYNDAGRTQQPSPDLSPESIYSGEVEVTQQLAPTTTLSGSLFASSIQSLITPEGSGTDADPLVYKNSRSPVQVIGAEAELRRDWRQGWMVDLVGSVHRASYRTPDAVSPGLR